MQSLAIAGDAREADPACALSPHHDRMRALAEAVADDAVPAYAYRGRPAGQPPRLAISPRAGS